MNNTSYNPLLCSHCNTAEQNKQAVNLSPCCADCAFLRKYESAEDIQSEIEDQFLRIEKLSEYAVGIDCLIQDMLSHNDGKDREPEQMRLFIDFYHAFVVMRDKFGEYLEAQRDELHFLREALTIYEEHEAGKIKANAESKEAPAGV